MQIILSEGLSGEQLEALNFIIFQRIEIYLSLQFETTPCQSFTPTMPMQEHEEWLVETTNFKDSMTKTSFRFANQRRIEMLKLIYGGGFKKHIYCAH